MKIQTHVFCGQKYTICFHEDYHGSCDVTPVDRKRWEMFILAKRQNTRSYLDTVIHEAIHACGLKSKNRIILKRMIYGRS